MAKSLALPVEGPVGQHHAIARRKEMIMKIKSHARLSRTLAVFLKITIAVVGLSVLAGFYDAYTYATLPAKVDPAETLFTSDVVWGLAMLVQYPLVIITFIIFLWWIYRTNKNLRTLSNTWMEFTPGWSVGWFFIPFANFYKPYQVVKEIWNASHGNETADRSLVGWWWALWLISIYAGRLVSRLVTTSNDASGYATEYMLQSVLFGIDLALYIVTLKLVTRIRAAYARNIVEPTGREYGGPAAVAPPPLNHDLSKGGGN